VLETILEIQFGPASFDTISDLSGRTDDILGLLHCKLRCHKNTAASRNFPDVSNLQGRISGGGRWRKADHDPRLTIEGMKPNGNERVGMLQEDLLTNRDPSRTTVGDSAGIMSPYEDA